jgi:hypothetical protein
VQRSSHPAHQLCEQAGPVGWASRCLTLCRGSRWCRWRPAMRAACGQLLRQAEQQRLPSVSPTLGAQLRQAFPSHSVRRLHPCWPCA